MSTDWTTDAAWREFVDARGDLPSFERVGVLAVEAYKRTKIAEVERGACGVGGVVTPRDIITHALQAGDRDYTMFSPRAADKIAGSVLAALDAAGLVVIDPANLKTGDQVVDGDGYTGTIIRFELCALIEYDRPTYFDPQAERWPIGQLRPIQLESSGGETTP